jgi:hypothetical protein
MDINQTIHLESHVVSTASASGKTNRWIVWYRPQSCWDAAVVHLPWALITGIPLLMSFLVPLHILPLIPCTLLRFTGYPCPFCGFTRSFWAMSEFSPVRVAVWAVCRRIHMEFRSALRRYPAQTGPRDTLKFTEKPVFNRFPFSAVSDKLGVSIELRT